MKKSYISYLMFFSLVVAVGACKSSSSDPTTAIALSSLNYSTTIYQFNVAASVSITPTTSPTQTIQTCTVSPSLPTGLTFNNDCSVSGSVNVMSGLTIYQATAKLSDGSSQSASFWLQVNDPANQITGIAYSPASVALVGPGPITAINPASMSPQPVDCAISPSLPVGLSIQKNCQIVGFATTKLNSTAYTVTASSMTKTFTTTLTLSASFYGLTGSATSLAAYFEGRAPTKNGTYSGCTAGGQPWNDLSGNNYQMNMYNCSATSGWFGSGTSADPYRFRNDNSQESLYNSTTITVPGSDSYSFPLTNSTIFDAGINHTFSISFWARALTPVVNLMGMLQKNFALTYTIGAEMTSDSTGVWMNGRNNSTLTFTPWSTGKGEWHHFAITSQYVSTTNASTHPKNVIFYVDGQTVNTVNGNTFLFEDSHYSSAGGATVLGGGNAIGNIVEFAQWKLFETVLTPAQVLSECQSYNGFLQDAQCTGGLRSVVMSDMQFQTNTCQGTSMKFVDFSNNNSAPGTDIHLTPQTTSDVQVFASGDTNCTTPLTTLTYASAATSLSFNIKVTAAGTKDIVFVPDNVNIPRHDLTITALNQATHYTVTPITFGVSTPIVNGVINLPDCYGNTNFTLNFLDSAGNPGTIGTNQTVTLTASNINGAGGSPDTYTSTWNSGANSSTVSINNGIGTYAGSIAVPGLPTFTFSSQSNTSGLCPMDGGS